MAVTMPAIKYDRYPYMVVLTLKEQDGDTYGDWLIENADGLWLRLVDDEYNITDTFYFEKEADATLFALRWA